MKAKAIISSSTRYRAHKCASSIGHVQTDLTGRMTKWIFELSEYEIDFQSQRTLQAQALADIVVENTLLSSVEPTAKTQDLDSKRACVLYFDGSAGQHQGAGFVV